MKAHQAQAQRLSKLGISHRAAAADLNTPKSLVSRYLKDGERTQKMIETGFVNQLNKYIEAKAAAGKRTSEYKTGSIAGKFSQLGLSLSQMAELAGADYLTLKRGIYEGRWTDEATCKNISTWIDRRLESRKEKSMLTKVSLREEVLDFFSLKRDPFTNEMEVEDDVFETREMARVEKGIMQAADRPSLIAVTGPSGCGKSTMMKRVEARFAKRKEVVLIKPRILEKQHLGAGHVVDAILADLGVEMLSRRSLEHKARLVGRALEEAHRDGKHVILLIDEAHLLRTDALLALKRIWEFEIGFQKLISIVLIGQTGLARVFRSNYELAEVSQRVDLLEIGALNGTLGSYLRHKIERAGGGNKELFDADAVREIGKKAETPLAINNVAAAALLRAWDAREKKVTAENVRSI